MSESRAIYYDNEWNEVRNCQECKLIKYTDYPRPRYSCADGVSIGGCDIPDGCRLPLWDIVRWHEITQLPPVRKRVEVELEFARNAIREIRMGLLVGNGNTWVIDGIDFVYENETNIKLLRWRYIL